MNDHSQNRQLTCWIFVIGMVFWFAVSSALATSCVRECTKGDKWMIQECMETPRCNVEKVSEQITSGCEALCPRKPPPLRTGTCESIQDALDRLEKPLENCARNQWCKRTKVMERLRESVADLQGKSKDCSHEPGAEKCKSLRTAIDRLKEVIKDCAQDPSCNRPELVKQLEETMSMFRDKWKRCLKEGSKAKSPAKTGIEGDSGSGSGK
jgi:hypothetical protein